MKQFDKWQLPDGEQHLQKWMEQTNDRQHGRLAYQGHKYRFASKHCSHRRVAVDVGGHVGLWSYFMAKDFEKVLAFEPMPEHIECWHENMKDVKNARLLPYALGEFPGYVSLQTYTEGSSGDTRVTPDQEGETPMYRLDDLFKEEALDLLKIDCEGYELNILRGAREVLLEFKPFIVVEQKAGHAEFYGQPQLGAVDFLLELGAKKLSADGGDYFFNWD